MQQAVLARSASSDPADRARRGKLCGGGLGIILGVAKVPVGGGSGRSEGEREEAGVDLHGLVSDDLASLSLLSKEVLI